MLGGTTNNPAANPWIERFDPDKLALSLARLREMVATGTGAPYMRYAHGDEHFALYLATCDQRCRRMIGVGIFDLSDFLWRDSYKAGQSVGDAVWQAISDDDTFGSLLTDLYGDQ